jgi:hypothetical protein
MTFKQTRVLVERIARRKCGDKARFTGLDAIASAVMAARDGMALHAKVNAAQEKAVAGKICESRRYKLISQTHLLSLLIHEREPGPRPLKDVLTESLVNELCSGDLLENEREAVLNPKPILTHVKVIEAYRRAIHDDGGAPTLREVRAELKQEKKDWLPKEWTLRKMVTNTFGLPLSQAKRGRRRSNQQRQAHGSLLFLKVCMADFQPWKPIALRQSARLR